MKDIFNTLGDGEEEGEAANLIHTEPQKKQKCLFKSQNSHS